MIDTFGVINFSQKSVTDLQDVIVKGNAFQEEQTQFPK